MRLWVDDKREAPEGWTRIYTAEEAIAVLDDIYLVEEISLDHDLGDTEHDPERSGYTVLQHIEKRAILDPNYRAPRIRIHTANVAARPRMEAAAANIERCMQSKFGSAYSPIAQVAERQTLNLKAGGSNPPRGSKG